MIFGKRCVMTCHDLQVIDDAVSDFLACLPDVSCILGLNNKNYFVSYHDEITFVCVGIFNCDDAWIISKLYLKLYNGILIHYFLEPNYAKNGFHKSLWVSITGSFMFITKGLHKFLVGVHFFIGTDFYWFKILNKDLEHLSEIYSIRFFQKSYRSDSFFKNATDSIRIFC